jgi:hypothetical protein
VSSAVAPRVNKTIGRAGRMANTRPHAKGGPAASLWRGEGAPTKVSNLRRSRRAWCSCYACPALAAIHPHAPVAPSQPAPQEQVEQDGHHHDPNHHEGREPDVRHRASNTPLGVVAGTSRGSIVLPARIYRVTPEWHAQLQLARCRELRLLLASCRHLGD